MHSDLWFDYFFVNSHPSFDFNSKNNILTLNCMFFFSKLFFLCIHDFLLYWKIFDKLAVKIKINNPCTYLVPAHPIPCLHFCKPPALLQKLVVLMRYFVFSLKMTLFGGTRSAKENLFSSHWFINHSHSLRVNFCIFDALTFFLWLRGIELGYCSRFYYRQSQKEDQKEEKPKMRKDVGTSNITVCICATKTVPFLTKINN